MLTENVASMVADKELESTLDGLVPLLRSDYRLNQFTDEVLRRHNTADQQLENVRRLANTPAEMDHVNAIAESWQRYKEQWSKRPVVSSQDKFSEKQNKEMGEFLQRLAMQLSEDVLPRCSNLLEYNTLQVSHSNDEDRRLVAQLTWGLLTVGIGAPLAGWLLGYTVARRIHHSIHQLSVRIRDAAGRLNSKLPPVTLEGKENLLAINQQMQCIVEQIENVFERLRQREREVLRADQLAAVGQVAAGVAHELRNPLTSVKMLVQTGLEGLPPAGLLGDDLAIIEREIRRMEACIQSFLDFARPPSAERRRTDLLPVVLRAVALLDGRARRQKVTIKSDLPAAPVELLIDPEQIHQVLVNLMLNGLDAMPHGGELRLTVKPQTDPPGVQVRLHDTGPGIAAPVLERLFEPFVSNKETGLGLGLSICRRLLEANGGSITGGNDPAGGAVFTFTLPTGE